MRMLRGCLVVVCLTMAACQGLAPAAASKPILILVAFDGWR